MMLEGPDNIACFVAFFEGYRRTPYLDAGGQFTIGYGARFVDGHPVTQRTRSMDQSEALSLLRESLDATERRIQADVLDYSGVIPIKAALAPWQWDALASLVYNIGEGAWRGSTMLELIRAGSLDKAALEFPRWCHVRGAVNQGLVMRRYWERHLWEDGYRAVQLLLDGINATQADMPPAA